MAFRLQEEQSLKRTTSKKYPKNIQKLLLSTLEDISFPLTDDWTEDLLGLIKDPKVGTTLK